MTGKSIPKVAYDGMNKEEWVEGNNVFQYAKHDAYSTHVEVETLSSRGKSKKEEMDLQKEESVCKPVAFADIGKIDIYRRV